MNFSLTVRDSWFTGGEEEVNGTDGFDDLKCLFCFSPSSTSEETKKKIKHY